MPHNYPREAPLVYVTPTDTMMVRPGQHVDPQGQVYHPYLAGWAEFWDVSLLDERKAGTREGCWLPKTRKADKDVILL